MDDIIMTAIEMDFKREYGSDFELLSREVLFSFKYIGFRVTGSRIFGSNKSKSIGDYLLEHIVNHNMQSEIFSSRYDLGNPEVLSSTQCRPKAIEKYLEENNLYVSSEVETYDKTLNINEIIKALKSEILLLTNLDYRCYRGACVDSPDKELNASYATKVLVMLFRFRKQWPKCFQRFRSPSQTKKPNMEMRDAYPLSGFDDIPKEGVGIYADLKLNLTYGMQTEERNALIQTMGRISDRYAKSTYFSIEFYLSYLSKSEPKPMLSNARIERELPLGLKSLPERLDKSFFVGLVIRELEHRIEGKKFINEFLNSEAANIPDMTNWTPASLDRNTATIYLSSKDKASLKVAVNEITNLSFSDSEIEKSIALSKNLNWVVKDPFETDRRFNHLEYIAAIITCLGVNTESIRIKAYWYGKRTTSDRPLHYLESIQNIDDLFDIPEFYLEYWFRRYALVLSRIVTQEAMWHERNKTEYFECQRIIQVFKTNSFNEAMKLVNAFYNAVPDPVGYSQKATFLQSLPDYRWKYSLN